MKKTAISFLMIISSLQFLFAQQKAFPTAEGAGQFVKGGRGGQVYIVSNLNDDGNGSFRDAVREQNRIVVFRVSGTIHLKSPLKILSNTTIAGQTAPGDGICLADYWVTLDGSNVIIRYMRFRLGDKNQLITNSKDPNCRPINPPFSNNCRPLSAVSGAYDGFGASYKKDIILDHCSVSWSNDEALSLKECDNTTVQWTMVSEPLNYSYHYEDNEPDFQEHGYGGIFGGFHATFHHNIYAHCKSRTPRFGASGADKTRVDFRNNIIYNWGINNVYGGEGGEFNVVNNYYKSGPNTKRKCQYVDMEASAKYFVSGNKMDDASCGTIVQKNVGLAGPTISNTIPKTETADAAYLSVLNRAGASLKRDAVDARIINEIKARTGGFVDVQGGYKHGTSYEISKNAWPVLNSTAAPLDSDNDGMPNTWETSNGLNPNDAKDANKVAADGYTMIEKYINAVADGGIPKPCTAPYPPSVTNTVSHTKGAIAKALTATGANLKWYTAATGGVGSSVAPTPSTTIVGTINYFVSQSKNGCESARARITVNITEPIILSRIRYEAERAFVSRGVVEKIHARYSGTGYVNAENVIGSYVEWTVNASVAGSFDISFVYANGGSTNRPAQLTLDGVTVSNNFSLPSTRGWSNWRSIQVQKVNLKRGVNKIRMTSITRDGLPSMDYLVVSGYATLNREEDAEESFESNSNESNNETQLFNIYPNPFTENLQLETKEAFEYSILDLTGDIVEKGASIGSITIGSSIPSGIYIVQIKTNFETKNFKVQKN